MAKARSCGELPYPRKRGPTPRLFDSLPGFEILDHPLLGAIAHKAEDDGRKRGAIQFSNNQFSVIASQRVGAKAPPDDRLREVIHEATRMDCFVVSLLAKTP